MWAAYTISVLIPSDNKDKNGSKKKEEEKTPTQPPHAPQFRELRAYSGRPILPRPYDYKFTRQTGGRVWQEHFTEEGFLPHPKGVPLFPRPTLKQCLLPQLAWEQRLRDAESQGLPTPSRLEDYLDPEELRSVKKEIREDRRKRNRQQQKKATFPIPEVG
jgi:hypothetical protein